MFLSNRDYTYKIFIVTDLQNCLLIKTNLNSQMKLKFIMDRGNFVHYIFVSSQQTKENDSYD